MVSQAAREADVINMLKEDHRKMGRLFQAFENATAGERTSIAKTAIRELERHADLEETLIYPIFQKAFGDQDRTVSIRLLKLITSFTYCSRRSKN